MTLSHPSVRRLALSLALGVCAMWSAPAATAQAEAETDTLRSPIFDTRVAEGHKRRGVRPAPRPATPRATSPRAGGEVRPEAPPVRPVSQKGSYVGTIISLEDSQTGQTQAAPAQEAPPADPPQASAPTPPLAPADSASPSFFDTRTAWGHKDIPEGRPSLFDTRIAWGHKDPAEREVGASLFDTRVAEGHKELPIAEEFAEGPFMVPADALELIDAQSHHVRSLTGTVLAQARHFPRIKRALARSGMPEELKYIALIESALDPQAVSSAGARGIWQIMPETAGDFGLDSMEVHDPILATPVAVMYLGRLHRMFDGDWLLALAAYNAGPGRVQRAVRRYQAGEGHRPTFWELRPYLPRETQAYVPRFLAALRYFDAGV